MGTTFPYSPPPFFPRTLPVLHVCSREDHRQLQPCSIEPSLWYRSTVQRCKCLCQSQLNTTDKIQSRDSSELQSYESQWQAAIDAILTDHSMPTLQCLVLAQLYCMQRGDYDRLLTYKALAVTLSSRLGLHQSQKRFALGASTSEMRKKVFWSLYTVDWYVTKRETS